MNNNTKTSLSCLAGMPMYPPPMRRRTNSLGSGNEGQDEGRHPESYERGDPRDHRMWMERSYMPTGIPPGNTLLKKIIYNFVTLLNILLPIQAK